MDSLLAANTFSLTPPILSTFPFKDISPVIAILESIYLFKAKDINEDTNVIPAEGPSLGTAPSGAWIWTLLFSKNSFYYKEMFSKFDKN